MALSLLPSPACGESEAGGAKLAGESGGTYDFSRSQEGFTLIEILVVLVITGMLAALAGPALQRMVQSMDRVGQRGLLAGQITDLAYRAWVEGKPYTLGGDAKAPTAYRLPVTEPWRVEFPQPITYSFNGVCSGGRLTLFGPDGWREDLRLEGPLCNQLLPADN